MEVKTKTPTKRTNQNNNRKIKKKHKKRIGKWLILLFIIIAIIIFASITPIFNIREIKVEGNNQISAETIISLSGLTEGENIFRNSKTKVIENIKENTYIKNVTMKRVLPGKIQLIIEERKINYQIKLIDGYIYIDNQGYILENSQKEQKVPILIGCTTSQEELLNGKRLNMDDLKKINTVLKIMDSINSINMEKLVTSINIKDNNNYILYLKKEKKYVYLGDASNLNQKILYMQKILDNEKKNSGKVFLDGNLNEGFKPYFREEKIK